SLRMITYVDDLQLIPTDRARARIINAVLNLPLLSVTDSSRTLSFSGLEYPLGTPNQNIPPGTVTLTFEEAGYATYATLENFTIAPNTYYTFIALGNALLDDEVTVLALPWQWRGE